MFTEALARRLSAALGRARSRRGRLRIATPAGVSQVVQRLEDRWLLSATSVPPPIEASVTVDYSVEEGRLTISAAVSSSIGIQESNGMVQVLVDGVALAHEAWTVDEVTSIAVVGSGGHDQIDLRAVTPLLFPNVVEINIGGGAGRDTIYGSAFGDGIDAGFDDDLIFGGPGNDTIDGGQGHDTLVGDDGDDFISGGSGDDLLNGRSGDDALHGGVGNDRLFGGSGRDSLTGEEDNDVLKGQGGRDTLHVENGDLIKGDTSRDVLYMDDAQPTLTLVGDEVFAFIGHWIDIV